MSQATEINEGMSISYIMLGMFSRKLLIIIPSLLGVALGGVFLMINKPRYLAEAQVVIENQYTPFDKTVGPQDAASGGFQVSDHMVLSQVSAMRSEDIAARVVDQLKLDANPEYNGNLVAHNVLSAVAVTFGFKDDPALFKPKELAAKTLASDLTIYPIPESNVIGVKSTAGEPSVAAAAANAVAETYVLSTREVGATSTDRARDWLSKQIDGLRNKVSESDQAVERYRADAGLTRGTSATLGTQQISELNTQIGTAQNARIEAQAKVDAVQRMLKVRGDVNASAEVLASPSLQRLKDEQVIAARDITQISATYLPNHPKMIAAQRHLDAVNNQIKIEAERVVASLQTQAQIADERAGSLVNELQKLKTSQAQAGFSDVRLQALQRDASANRVLLQSMLSRYADANARQDTSLQPGFARIIQRAVPPAAPYFPKKGPTLILSTLAGLLLGLGLAFVMEILSQPSVTAAKTLPRRGDVLDAFPVAAANFDLPKVDSPVAAKTQNAAPRVPTLAHGNFPVAHSTAMADAMLAELTTFPQSMLAESSIALASHFKALTRIKAVQIVTLASLGGDGPNSAMAAIATGRALAAEGKRVMLLDLTSGESSVENLLILNAGPGLIDLVAGTADFTKSVVRDSLSKMHFVRLGAVTTTEDEDSVVMRLPAILDALRNVYDMTIINIGEARASVVQVLANADATVLLAEDERFSEASETAKALEEAGGTKTMLVKLVHDASGETALKASA